MLLISQITLRATAVISTPVRTIISINNLLRPVALWGSEQLEPGWLLTTRYAMQPLSPNTRFLLPLVVYHTDGLQSNASQADLAPDLPVLKAVVTHMHARELLCHLLNVDSRRNEKKGDKK